MKMGKTCFYLLSLIFYLFCLSACADAVSGVDTDRSGNTDEPARVEVTGIRLDRSTLVFGLEGTGLTATVEPADATDTAVIWTSSDPEVATVDDDGKITGIKAGRTTVTVATADGEHKATCAVAVPVSYTVADTTEWNAALSAISTDPGGTRHSYKVFSIEITDDFNAAGTGNSGSSTVTGQFKEVWLTGDRTITLVGKGSLIRTALNQTFVIDGPVLRGNADNNTALVYIADTSTLELRSGAVKDNTNTSTISDSIGGVYVGPKSTFTMKSGTISGNTGNGAGGVYAKTLSGTTGGTITIEGGAITGNTGIGVYTWLCVLTMKDVTVSDNSGTGVYVGAFTDFTMEDGTVISGNSGGGMVLDNYATFTMEGGTISGNSAANGGGVVLTNATFTMEGGTISGNSAANNGGGVYMNGYLGSSFTMKGGTICGNTATNNGGGVIVYGTFMMEDGDITENSAGTGGGVCVMADGLFEMYGGTVTGNTAPNGKNGVYSNGGVFYGYGGTLQRD